VITKGGSGGDPDVIAALFSGDEERPKAVEGTACPTEAG
jgi:hypothetical protein